MDTWTDSSHTSWIRGRIAQTCHEYTKIVHTCNGYTNGYLTPVMDTQIIGYEVALSG